jgi:O-antigen/teichoic acid export membrane protein
MAGLRRELAQPLFRNAYALMLNTVVNSGLGLLYWVVAAHEYTEEEVGRGNALISLMLLVSTLTQLNFSGALMRFLPRSGTRSKQLLLAAYGVSSIVAVLVTAAVMAYCHLARDPGDPLYASAPFAVWFVVATAAWSLFNLQDSALTGLHGSTWIPLENGLYGLVKLILLVVVAHTSLVDGVFTSWTLPVVALLVPVNLLIFRRLLPRHAAEGAATQEPPSRAVLQRYMTGDYAGTVFRQLSSTFLPVLVVSVLGAAQGAYFLPTQTIFAAIAMLQLAITNSLVVEAASNPEAAARYARSMLRRIAVTILPAAVVIIIAAPFILMLFGAHYSHGATPVLRLMMLALFPGMLLALYVTRCRLENRTGTLALVQGVQAAMMIGGTVLLAGRLGLAAVGWSVLVAELLPALLVAPGMIRWLRGDHRSDRPTGRGHDRRLGAKGGQM